MLKRVSIQNFKSLKDVTLDLQKVNLLIGPNNSGKSNFLKALEFFNMVYDDVVVKYHNIYRVYNTDIVDLSFKKQKSCISISCVDLFTNSYGISIADNLVRTYNNPDDKIELIETSSTELINDEEWKRVFKIYYRSVSTSIVFKPDIVKISSPGPIRNGEEYLESDLSNVVDFLDYMLSKYRRKVFNKKEQDLERCVPEFDEISLDIVIPNDQDKKFFGEYEVFKMIGLTNNKHGVTYWANELSEGTLYFLALLCIINQPDPPKLLLLEEPEKGIHPRRIWEIMKFIFQLAEEKDIQIILTTHNEHVVNAFSSIPEAVFVFDKDEEGATHVRNLQRDIIEVSNEKSEENGFDPIDFTSDLGKSWLYGLIGGVPEENI